MPSKLLIQDPIVSVHWLLKHLSTSNLIVIDASMKKVITKPDDPDNLVRKQIKGARFLDIKKEFSEPSAKFPNTLLSPDKFSEAARQLGINCDSAIVVYDESGIYSSPRVWWMFKAMGHHNIAVLDGGLPEWKRNSFPVEDKNGTIFGRGDFVSKYDPRFISDYHKVLDATANEKTLILDARSTGRFKGTEQEPRIGLRSGHIPNSKNIPYSQLLNGEVMKPREELMRIYLKLTEKDNTLIFSCGSGITACILALGAEIVGIKEKSVYDGSWSEWGSMAQLPIEK